MSKNRLKYHPECPSCLCSEVKIAEPESELKPCPFCGGRPKLTYWEEPVYTFYTVSCKRCRSKSGSYSSKPYTENKWNERHDGEDKTLEYFINNSSLAWHRSSCMHGEIYYCKICEDKWAEKQKALETNG
jgi:hypothetical protein